MSTEQKLLLAGKLQSHLYKEDQVSKYTAYEHEILEF